MELSILNSNELTMSSKEVAELTGKRHSDVMRDIKKLVQQTDNQYERTFALVYYLDPKGETRPMYQLTKKEVLLLVSGYNAKLRLAIIDRWEELEKAQQFKLPQTFSEALLLAGNLAKENEALQIEQKTNQPKVKSFDTFMSKETLQNATTVGQLFGLSAVKLNTILSEHNVYNKRCVRSKVFQTWFIKAGFGKTIENEAGFSQSLFTPKGIDFISGLLNNRK